MKAWHFLLWYLIGILMAVGVSYGITLLIEWVFYLVGITITDAGWYIILAILSVLTGYRILR